MTPCRFDKQLGCVVEALRKARGIKQHTLACALNMATCEYSKRISGFRALSCNQLRLIGREIGVTHLQILAITDACLDARSSVLPVSTALATILCNISGEADAARWTKEQIQNVLRNLIAA